MSLVLHRILDGEIELEDGDPYGSQAEFYDVLNERTDDYEMQEQVVRDYIPEGATILYLGNGSGNLTERIEEEYEVIGLDASREMLELSDKKTDAEHVQGDIRQLPFQEGAFDAVVMLGRTITYLHDDEEVEEMMSEAARALKDGGVFVFDSFREDAGDPEKERLGGHGQYHFGRIMVEVEDEVRDYDPGKNTWTRDVEYRLYDRSSGREEVINDTQRHRGFEPEELRSGLQEHGFASVEQEGRHAERKEVEDGDNEVITKAELS